MASLIEAIEIKRKSYFEFEGAPYHCLDVEVSKPTARRGTPSRWQTRARKLEETPYRAATVVMGSAHTSS